jgi:iron-sulfur cluster repair protein YtfE (RIC family)
MSKEKEKGLKDSQFFNQLKQEHRLILDTLLEVKKLGVHTMEGRNALTAARDLLCRHFQKEDELIYPEMRKAAGEDPDKQKIIREFIEEMKEITHDCFAFFDKYTMSGGGFEFMRDFDRLYNELESRLKKEQSILFTS